MASKKQDLAEVGGVIYFREGNIAFSFCFFFDEKV